MANLGISVVIPTMAREGPLSDTLGDLSRQRDVKYEVLIVSQGSTDLSGLAQALPDHVSCRCYFQPEPNASLARNVGLLEARFDKVVFLDDDIEIESSFFLHKHCDLLDSNQDISAVCGQILLPNQAPRKSRHWMSRRERVGWLYHPANFDADCLISSGMAGNLSVRREQALNVGGMDAHFIRGAHREESDFCLRLVQAYGPVLFTPDVSIIHLQHRVGGCRNWDSTEAPKFSGLYAPHHYTGEWYFIRRGLRLGTIRRRDVPDYLFAVWRRQFWNSANRWRPGKLLTASRASARGLLAASRLLRQEPRYLNSSIREAYKLVWQSGNPLD